MAESLAAWAFGVDCRVEKVSPVAQGALPGMSFLDPVPPSLKPWRAKSEQFELLGYLFGLLLFGIVPDLHAFELGIRNREHTDVPQFG